MESEFDESVSDFRTPKALSRKHKAAGMQKRPSLQQKRNKDSKASKQAFGLVPKSTKPANDTKKHTNVGSISKSHDMDAPSLCETAQPVSGTQSIATLDERSHCPTCGKLFDIAQLPEHTKACLRANFQACKGMKPRSLSKSRRRSLNLGLKPISTDSDESYFCASCGTDISLLSFQDRNTHVNRCLDITSKVSKVTKSPKKGWKGEKKPPKDKSPSNEFRCLLCFRALSSSRGLKIHLTACQKKNKISTMAALALHRPETTESEMVDDEILAEFRRVENNEAKEANEGVEAPKKANKKKVPRKRKPIKDIEDYNEEMMQLAIRVSNGEDLDKKKSRSKKQNAKYIIPVMLELSPNSKRQQLEGRLRTITSPGEESSEDERIASTPALPTTSLRLSNVRVLNGNNKSDDGDEIYNNDDDRPGPSGISVHRADHPRQVLPEVLNAPQHVTDTNCRNSPFKPHDDELQSPEVSSSNIKHHALSDSGESPSTSSVESHSTDVLNQHSYYAEDQPSLQRPNPTAFPESRWSVACNGKNGDNTMYRVRNLLSQFDKPDVDGAQKQTSNSSDSNDHATENTVSGLVVEEQKKDVNEENIDSTLLAIQALDNAPAKDDVALTPAESTPYDDQIHASQRSESQKLHILINNPQFSDAKIFVGESKETVHLHKNILYCNCPKLLDEIEVAEDNKTDLHLKEYSKSEIMPMVCYIYSGLVKPLTIAANKNKDLFLKTMQLMAKYEIYVTDTDQMILDAAVEEQNVLTQSEGGTTSETFTTDNQDRTENTDMQDGAENTDTQDGAESSIDTKQTVLSGDKVEKPSKECGNLQIMDDPEIDDSHISENQEEMPFDELSFHEDLALKDLTQPEPATIERLDSSSAESDLFSDRFGEDDGKTENLSFGINDEPSLSEHDLFGSCEMPPVPEKENEHADCTSSAIFENQDEGENSGDVSESTAFSDGYMADKDESYISNGSSILDESCASLEEEAPDGNSRLESDISFESSNHGNQPKVSTNSPCTPIKRAKRKRKDTNGPVIRKSKRMSTSSRRSSLTKSGWRHKNCPCCTAASGTVYIKDKLPKFNTRERTSHKMKMFDRRKDMRKSLLAKRTGRKIFALTPSSTPRTSVKSSTPRKKVVKSDKSERSQIQRSTLNKKLPSDGVEGPSKGAKNEESVRHNKRPESADGKTSSVPKTKKLKLDKVVDEQNTPKSANKKIMRRSRSSSSHKSLTQTVYVSERLPRFKEREHIRSRPEVANMGKSTKAVARLSGSKITPVAKKASQCATGNKNDSTSPPIKMEPKNSPTEESDDKIVSNEPTDHSNSVQKKHPVKEYKFKKVLLTGYACPSPSTAFSQPCTPRKVCSSSEDGYDSDGVVLDNICFDDSFENDCLDTPTKPSTQVKHAEPGHVLPCKLITPNTTQKNQDGMKNELSDSYTMYVGPVPITPMPNFRDMATPEVLHRAESIGLKKTLGKVKLKTKLEEQYLYTHQIVSDDEDMFASAARDSPEEDDLSDDLCVNTDEACDISLQLSKLSASPNFHWGSNVFSFSALSVDEVQELSTQVIETMHANGSLLSALQEAKQRTGSIKRGSRQDRDRCWDIVTPGRPDYNPKINAILSRSEEFQNAISRPLTGCIVKHYNEYIKYQFDCLGIVCDQMETLLKERDPPAC